MSINDLFRRAEKIVALKQLSAVMDCQTGKSQGSLLRDLMPE